MKTDIEMVSSMRRIADALERQTVILDDLQVELKALRMLVSDCSYYPSDERQVPRIVVGIAGAVETVSM